MASTPAVMRLIDRLRFRWWEWADASSHPRQRLPTVLELGLNDTCDSKCQMCYIWKNDRNRDITSEELSTILGDPVFGEVRDVIIQGGEPTLREDLGSLAQVILTRMPRLQGLSLITNGIDEHRVVSSIEDIGRRCRDAGIPLHIMVSIDGIGEVHDRIRGVPGNFANADRVVERLSKSPLVRACLIGCTFVRQNVYEAEHVLMYARSRSVHARFRLGVPHRRLYNGDVSGPFDLDDAQRYHLACFLDHLRLNYEPTPGRCAFYLSLRNQLIYGAPRSTGCVWRNRGATLTSRGELAYCAIESPPLGVLLQERGDDLYWKKGFILKDIHQNRCPQCMHDYDGLRERSILLERMARNAVKRIPNGKKVFDFSLNVKSSLRDRSADRHARRVVAGACSTKDSGTRSAVLLCGGYGAETLAEKAILAGLVLSLRGAGWREHIDLASFEPFISRETLRQLPELGVRRVETLENARAHIAQGEYRLVAVAGGPPIRYGEDVFALLGLFTEAEAAATARAIVGSALAPRGHSNRRDAATRRLLSLSQQTLFRDQASLDAVRTSLKLESDARVAPNPALVWTRRQLLSNSSTTEPSVLLALREVSVSEFASAASAPGKTAAERKLHFEQELLELVKELQRLQPAWKLKLQPTTTYAREGDDRVFFHRAFSSCPELLAELPWKRRTAVEDFAAFRAAQVVVGMRAQNALVAAAAGVPHVLIGASDNFSGREFAARVLEVAAKRIDPPPPDVEETYTGIWKEALAAAA